MSSTDNTAPSALVGMTSDAKDCKQVYDSWAQSYEQDVQKWGYDAPTKVAALLAQHCPKPTCILDAGAGDGLSGVALRQHYKEPGVTILGADLSAQMLQIAGKRKCYSSTKQVDLNQLPYPFDDNTFDAIACVGTMTYVNPTSLQELCRIVKPGGYICYTNRTDKLDHFQDEESRLAKEGVWKLVERQGPMPYLPNHQDFANKIQVVILLFQTAK